MYSLYRTLAKDPWYFIQKDDVVETGWTIYEECSTKRFRLMPPEPSLYNDMEYLVSSFSTPERALEYYIKNLAKYEHSTET